MPEAAVQALISAGVLGPVLVLVGWYVLKLHAELREANEKRTQDAQAVVGKILALVENQHKLDQEQNTLLAQIQTALVDLRDTIRSLPQGGRR